MSEKIKLQQGDYLLREGDESTQMYYVHSGTLAVYKRKGNSEQQIGTIYAGELVGEMSFLDKAPRSATVRAIGNCELVMIPNSKFEKFYAKLPKWYKVLINTLLDRLRRANARIRI